MLVESEILREREICLEILRFTLPENSLFFRNRSEGEDDFYKN